MVSRVACGSGFTPLGKVKVNGKSATYWSQEPDRFIFRDDGKVNTNAIREWIEPI